MVVSAPITAALGLASNSAPTSRQRPTNFKLALNLLSLKLLLHILNLGSPYDKGSGQLTFVGCKHTEWLSSGCVQKCEVTPEVVTRI